MPRRIIRWTEEKISRFIKEGRGQGEGPDYKPWLTTHDISSRGRKQRLKGWKTNRLHYFFSDLEANTFFYFNWIDEIVDIREHFPMLKREETIAIAEENQIKYPIDPHTQTPLVIYTDFLLTIKQNDNKILQARTVVPANELENPRKRDKLKIEYLYWRKYGVHWSIITEYDIPKIIVDNIKLVYQSYSLKNYNQEIDKLIEILNSSFHNASKSITLRSFLSKLDKQYNQEPGTFLTLVKHLIARKIIKVDFSKKVTSSLPLSDFILLPNINGENLNVKS